MWMVYRPFHAATPFFVSWVTSLAPQRPFFFLYNLSLMFPRLVHLPRLPPGPLHLPQGGGAVLFGNPELDHLAAFKKNMYLNGPFIFFFFMVLY